MFREREGDYSSEAARLFCCLRLQPPKYNKTQKLGLADMTAAEPGCCAHSRPIPLSVSISGWHKPSETTTPIWGSRFRAVGFSPQKLFIFRAQSFLFELCWKWNAFDLRIILLLQSPILRDKCFDTVKGLLGSWSGNALHLQTIWLWGQCLGGSAGYLLLDYFLRCLSTFSKGPCSLSGREVSWLRQQNRQHLGLHFSLTKSLLRPYYVLSTTPALGTELRAEKACFHGTYILLGGEMLKC